MADSLVLHALCKAYRKSNSFAQFPVLHRRHPFSGTRTNTQPHASHIYCIYIHIDEHNDVYPQMYFTNLMLFLQCMNGTTHDEYV